MKLSILRPHPSPLPLFAAVSCLALAHCAHSKPSDASGQPAAASAQAVAAPPRDAFRTKIPEPEAAPALNLPMPTSTVLANGLTVWSSPKRDLPLVHVLAVVKSGAAQDPEAQAGLASITAEVMRRGTTSRSAAAIAKLVESQGGSFDVQVDDDSITFSIGAMTENVGPVLDVLADVLQHPSLAPAEFARVRDDHIAELLQVEAEPRASVQAVFRKVTFGAHPYGHTSLGTLAALRGLRPQAARTFVRRHLRPANTHLVVVGDMDAEQAVREIERRLGGWAGAKGVQAEPTAPSAHEAEVALVDRPDAPQSQVIVGGLGVARDDPDYYPLVLGNAILGGMFNSRLNMNLRESKGWTYGVRSGFAFNRAAGSFSIGTGIKTEVTPEAIGEIFAEIAGMRDRDATDAELQGAKNRFTLSLPGNFQSLGGIAQMVANLALYDLPTSYYRDLTAALNAVTLGDVRRVMREHVVPERLSIVVVGDRAKLEHKLTALGLGPVCLRDAEGALIGAAPQSGKPLRPTAH